MATRGTRSRPYIDPLPMQVPAAVPFYEANPGRNHWLDVRIGGNVTGTPIEKGVFAACDIPPHTRLAPYLG
jgi:hypothetical protein